jgi:DNA-binding GntR family transcriptional regulator
MRDYDTIVVSIQVGLERNLADEKLLYRAQNLGSGTFIISKPKRKAHKRRQSKLKGTVRGARK